MSTEGPMAAPRSTSRCCSERRPASTRAAPNSLSGHLDEFGDGRPRTGRRWKSDPVGVHVSDGSVISTGTWPRRRGIIDSVQGRTWERLEELGCDLEPTHVRHVARTRLGFMGRVAPRAGVGQPAAAARQSGEPRADQARGVVGVRQRPSSSPAHRSAMRRGSAQSSTTGSPRCSIDSTCSPCRPRRCGRSRSCSDGRSTIGDREMDTYHRWMEATTYATFRGTAGHQRAGRVRRSRVAHGHAVDRPPTRRRRTAAAGQRLRDDDRKVTWRMEANARDLIERLGMTPLPVEGTFIVSTYRSEAESDMWWSRWHSDDRSLQQRSSEPIAVPPIAVRRDLALLRWRPAAAGGAARRWLERRHRDGK